MQIPSPSTASAPARPHSCGRSARGRSAAVGVGPVAAVRRAGISATCPAGCSTLSAPGAPHDFAHGPVDRRRRYRPARAVRGRTRGRRLRAVLGAGCAARCAAGLRSTTCSASRSVRPTTSTSPAPRSPGSRRCSAPTRSPSVAGSLAESFVPKGHAHTPTTSGRSNSPPERHTSESAMSEKMITVTQKKSGAQRQAQVRVVRCAPSASAASASHEHAARSARDPRHAAPAVPHLITVSDSNSTEILRATVEQDGELTMHVHDLAPAPRLVTKNPKRVGRGTGGKGGKTAGRGTKGQRSAAAARSPAASRVARCRSSSACRSCAGSPPVDLRLAQFADRVEVDRRVLDAESRRAA